MGPRRRRRGQRNKKKRNKYSKFQEQTLQRNLDDTRLYAERKERQKAHVARIIEREEDLLSRTVYVSQVRDLKDAQNLIHLQHFLETNYGPVESCKVAMYYSGRSQNQIRNYPPARVRFHSVLDAQKIFDGMSLKEARKQKAKIQVPCQSVGYNRGTIRVQPSDRYDGISQDVKHLPITVQVSSASLGHWFIGAQDIWNCTPFIEDRRNEEHELFPDHWLEEASMTNVELGLSIDFGERSITIQCNAPSGSSYELSFRFKDLVGPRDSIESC